MNCMIRGTSESATSTIHIIELDTRGMFYREYLRSLTFCSTIIVQTFSACTFLPPDAITSLKVQSHLAQLMHERITVQLEWIILLSQIYYQQLLQNISFHVVPDPERATVNTGNRILQLTLLYNTLYNVSFTQRGICGQSAFIELKYMYSSDVMMM